MGPRGLTASRAPRPFLDGEDLRAAELGRGEGVRGQFWGGLRLHHFRAATLLPSLSVSCVPPFMTAQEAGCSPACWPLPTSYGNWCRVAPQGSLELAWLVSLFPQPQLGTRRPLSPSHRWWLTGTLPEDRAAHELEEALGVEAGPVDRDSVLGKWGKDEVRGRVHMHPLLACLLTQVTM